MQKNLRKRTPEGQLIWKFTWLPALPAGAAVCLDGAAGKSSRLGSLSGWRYAGTPSPSISNPISCYKASSSASQCQKGALIAQTRRNQILRNRVFIQKLSIDTIVKHQLKTNWLRGEAHKVHILVSGVIFLMMSISNPYKSNDIFYFRQPHSIFSLQRKLTTHEIFLINAIKYMIVSTKWLLDFIAHMHQVQHLVLQALNIIKHPV